MPAKERKPREQQRSRRRLVGELTAKIQHKLINVSSNDDCVDSFFMSMLYEGRLRTFTPVTHLSRTGITLIRPFIYLPEKDIKVVVNKYGIPVVKNLCPAAGATKREEIKKLLAQIQASNPYAREMIMTSLKNSDKYSL